MSPVKNFDSNINDLKWVLTQTQWAGLGEYWIMLVVYVEQAYNNIKSVFINIVGLVENSGIFGSHIICLDTTHG